MSQENYEEFEKMKEDTIIEIRDDLGTTNINVLLGKLIFVTKASDNSDEIYLTVKLKFEDEDITDEAIDDLNTMIDAVVGIVI